VSLQFLLGLFSAWETRREGHSVKYHETRLSQR